MNDKIDAYVATHSKSQGTGLALTVFLGPIGLLYGNWIAGVILLVVAVMFAATVVVPVLCWLASMITSWVVISNHNERVRAAAELGVAD